MPTLSAAQIANALHAAVEADLKAGFSGNTQKAVQSLLDNPALDPMAIRQAIVGEHVVRNADGGTPANGTVQQYLAQMNESLTVDAIKSQQDFGVTKSTLSTAVEADLKAGFSGNTQKAVQSLLDNPALDPMAIRQAIVGKHLVLNADGGTPANGTVQQYLAQMNERMTVDMIKSKQSFAVAKDALHTAVEADLKAGFSGNTQKAVQQLLDNPTLDPFAIRMAIEGQNLALNMGGEPAPGTVNEYMAQMNERMTVDMIKSQQDFGKVVNDSLTIQVPNEDVAKQLCARLSEAGLEGHTPRATVNNTHYVDMSRAALEKAGISEKVLLAHFDAAKTAVSPTTSATNSPDAVDAIGVRQSAGSSFGYSSLHEELEQRRGDIRRFLAESPLSGLPAAEHIICDGKLTFSGNRYTFDVNYPECIQHAEALAEGLRANGIDATFNNSTNTIDFEVAPGSRMQQVMHDVVALKSNFDQAHLAYVISPEHLGGSSRSSATNSPDAVDAWLEQKAGVRLTGAPSEAHFNIAAAAYKAAAIESYLASHPNQPGLELVLAGAKTDLGVAIATELGGGKMTESSIAQAKALIETFPQAAVTPSSTSPNVIDAWLQEKAGVKLAGAPSEADFAIVSAAYETAANKAYLAAHPNSEGLELFLGGKTDLGVAIATKLGDGKMTDASIAQAKELTSTFPGVDGTVEAHTAPRLPATRLAGNTTVKGAGVGASTTGAILGIKGLYDQLNTTNGTYWKDQAAGNADQAMWSSANLTANVTATGTGLIAAQSEITAILGKEGIRGLGAASRVAGAVAIPAAVVAGGAEFGAAMEAVDGRRAARVAGSTIGAIALGAGGGAGGGALAGPPGAVVGGLGGGLLGAFTMGPLAESAFGQKLQTTAERWRREEVAENVGAVSYQYSEGKLNEIGGKQDHAMERMAVAMHQFDETVKKHGGMQTAADVAAIDASRKTLFEAYVEVNKAPNSLNETNYLGELERMKSKEEGRTTFSREGEADRIAHLNQIGAKTAYGRVVEEQLGKGVDLITGSSKVLEIADQQIDALVAQRRGQGPLTPAVEVAVNNIRLPEWERKPVPYDGQLSPEAVALILGESQKPSSPSMQDALAKFIDPTYQPAGLVASVPNKPGTPSTGAAIK